MSHKIESVAAYYIAIMLRDNGALSAKKLARISRIRTYVGCETAVVHALAYMLKRGFVVKSGTTWSLSKAGQQRLTTAQWFDYLDSRVSHQRVVGLEDEPKNKTARKAR